MPSNKRNVIPDKLGYRRGGKQAQIRNPDGDAIFDADGKGTNMMRFMNWRGQLDSGSAPFCRVRQKGLSGMTERRDLLLLCKG